MHLSHWVQEVWQIRGRHFSTVRRIFSRQKCARMSARSARDSIMRPPRHQESRIKRSARLLLPASASIVESRRTCRTREGNPLARLNIPSASPGMTIPAKPRLLPLSQTSDTLYNALSLTRSTIPPPHHKSVPAASPQTEKFPRSSQPSAPAQPPIHPSS